MSDEVAFLIVCLKTNKRRLLRYHLDLALCLIFLISRISSYLICVLCCSGILVQTDGRGSSYEDKLVPDPLQFQLLTIPGDVIGVVGAESYEDCSLASELPGVVSVSAAVSDEEWPPVPDS